MNKVILTITILFLINVSAKEIKKGTVEIAGGIAMGGSIHEVKYDFTGNKIKTNSFTMSPSFLYYVLPNIAIGTGFSFNYSKTEEENYENKNLGFGISPKIRYNYSINKNLNFNMDATFLILRANNKLIKPLKETSLWKSQTGWGLSAGFDYFIKEDIALSSHLNYTNYNNSHYSSYDGNGDQSELGLFIGVVILFENLIQ